MIVMMKTSPSVGLAEIVLRCLVVATLFLTLTKRVVDGRQSPDEQSDEVKGFLFLNDDENNNNNNNNNRESPIERRRRLLDKTSATTKIDRRKLEPKTEEFGSKCSSFLWTIHQAAMLTPTTREALQGLGFNRGDGEGSRVGVDSEDKIAVAITGRIPSEFPRILDGMGCSWTAPYSTANMQVNR